MEQTEQARARRAAYMREWIKRPGNYERQLESKRRSMARQKAADSEGYLAAARQRYARHIAEEANREKHNGRNRAAYAAGRRSRRRGLTPADQHDYWVYQRGLCDFCKTPYPDPDTTSGQHRDLAVDHDRDHVGCKSSIGCRDCVRGQGHRVCNVIEGVVKAALQRGLLTGIWGPLADYLANPPIQRWLAERDAAQIAD